MNNPYFRVTIKNSNLYLDDLKSEEGQVTYFTEGITQIEFVNTILEFIKTTYPDFKFKEGEE